MFLPKNKKSVLCGVFLATAFFFCFCLWTKALAVVDSAALVGYIIPINTFLYGLLTSLLKWSVYLIMAAYALQTTLANPQWINVDSVFVQTGLNVTTTLANILLVAVFIVIALGFVFRVEAFNSQKALIKFFVAALLVNFAPLFVRMAIDISNIAMASIMVGGSNIIMDTCKQFAGQMWSSGMAILRDYLINAGLSAIPISSLASNVIRIGGLLANNGWMLTQLPQYLVQIMVGEILAGLMFSYAIFFITRVFMMMLLAVLAPLAILASVLPQTSNLFKTWLSWLIGWATAGIMTLFLLTLGLSTIKAMIPSIADSYFELSGSQSIFLRQDTMYWLMLCVYMMTVDVIVAGTIPEISGKIAEKTKAGLAPVAKMGGQRAGKIKESFESGWKKEVGYKEEKPLIVKQSE